MRSMSPRLPAALLLPLGILALAAGCKIDNGLSGKQAQSVPFDTGTTYTPDSVTTGDSAAAGDSGGTVTTNENCVDNTFAGHSLAALSDCSSPATGTPSWTLVTKFSDMTLGMTLSSPAFGPVIDTNGNGIIDDGDTTDVVVAPYSGGVTVYNGVDGSVVWHSSTGSIEQTSPTIADLDGDGLPEIVIGGLYGSYAFHGNDGSTYWSGAASSGIKAYCGAVSVADLDGDGNPEVLLGKEILNGQTGAQLATGAYGEGSSYSGEAPDSIAADIDLDGQQEVIVGNAAYSIDGGAIWHNGGPDGYPAVGNFDDDPEAEIVVAAMGTVYLYDTDGSTIWSYNSGGTYQGPPAIADLDGDGNPDIAVPTSNGVIALDMNGNLMWKYTSSGSYMFDGVSTYDLDGDGAWEVLDNGATSLRILDGTTGAVLSEFAHATQQYSCGQAPVVADIDGDNAVEIGYGVYSTPGGFGVLQDGDDGFSPGLTYWNQDPFAITNINADMTVPTDPDPNWATYNSFRAGPPIDTLFPNKNLTIQIDDVCTVECNSGNVTVWWSLGNNGTQDIADDVTVDFYGVSDSGDVLLGTTVYSGNKPAGWLGNSVQTELTGVPKPLYDIYVTIDGGNSSDGRVGTVGECDESDNEARLGAPICL